MGGSLDGPVILDVAHHLGGVGIARLTLLEQLFLEYPDSSDGIMMLIQPRILSTKPDVVDLSREIVVHSGDVHVLSQLYFLPVVYSSSSVSFLVCKEAR